MKSCCYCCWNAWFTKARLGYDRLANGNDERRRKMWQEKALTVIVWTPALRRETVGACLESSPGWQMRQQQKNEMEALLWG